MDFSALNDLDLPIMLPGENVPDRDRAHSLRWRYPDGSPMPERALLGPGASEWARLKTEYHQVTSMWLEDRPVNISTVWLGIDHQFGSGPPLIFESMIFTDLDWMDQYCRRYATWGAAKAGHEKIVCVLLALGAVPVGDAQADVPPPPPSS